MKNPIYIEHSTHTNCDCYKIDLPWTSYWKHTVMLCPVSEGEQQARLLAQGTLVQHLIQATTDLPISDKAP